MQKGSPLTLPHQKPLKKKISQGGDTPETRQMLELMDKGGIYSRVCSMQGRDDIVGGEVTA